LNAMVVDARMQPWNGICAFYSPADLVRGRNVTGRC
jgi:hypothetical protein